MVRLRTVRLGTCRECGFASPFLDICDLTGLCAECSRRRLGRLCLSCPDRRRCDAAVKGIRFVKELEMRLDIYVDFTNALIDRSRGAVGIDARSVYLSEIAALVYSKLLMGLFHIIRRVGEGEGLVGWIRTVFSPAFLRGLASAQLPLTTETDELFEGLCREFGCSKIGSVLKRLYDAVLFTMLGSRDPLDWATRFLNPPFRDIIIEELRHDVSSHEEKRQ